MSLGYKVIIGKTQDRATLDSTWSDLSKANKRRDTLKSSNRKSRHTHKDRSNIWVVPMTEEDPLGYRKEKKNEY